MSGRRRWRPGARFIEPRRAALVVATLLTLACLIVPRLEAQRPRYDLVAVVDITGSMNSRDYLAGDRPQSRLDAVKAGLVQLVAALPCQSRLGLAVFSERQAFLLFEPLEVCGQFDVLSGAIKGLDWRMAWEGDSHVADGLYSAVALAASLHSDLLFLSDGQEAPPLPWTGGPQFDGKPGAVGGLIVGTGGYTLAPIPKFDDAGREVGFYAAGDVPGENTAAPPPPGAEEREGYNPRNAPFGAVIDAGTEYLSAVREPYLKTLATTAGVTYAHLDDGAGLVRAVEAAARPRPVTVGLDLRPLPGGLALLVLVALYGMPPLGGLWRRLSGSVKWVRASERGHE